jgi:hypothetical protein
MTVVTVVNALQHRRFLLALWVLLLSSLACAVPVSTTVPSIPPTPTTVFTTPERTVVKTPTTPEPQTAIVKAAAINVRQKPDGEVIAILNAGNTVTLMDDCPENWCKIQTVIKGETVTGFIFKGCLRIKSSLGCTAK